MLNSILLPFFTIMFHCEVTLIMRPGLKSVISNLYVYVNGEVGLAMCLYTEISKFGGMSVKAQIALYCRLNSVDYDSYLCYLLAEKL
jgi:hypothetical protein